MFVSFKMFSKQVPGIIANSLRKSSPVLSGCSFHYAFSVPSYDQFVHNRSSILNKIMEAFTAEKH